MPRRKKTDTAENLTPTTTLTVVPPGPTVLDAAHTPAPLKGKVVTAYAAVKMPSEGNGITGARLYTFEVPIESATTVSGEDTQGTILDKATLALEDGLIG